MKWTKKDAGLNAHSIGGSSSADAFIERNRGDYGEMTPPKKFQREEPPKCIVGSCNRTPVAKGMCGKHNGYR